MDAPLRELDGDTTDFLNRPADQSDALSITDFEADLSSYLYKNRLSSGSYHPPPVRRIDIPKGDGRAGTRPWGIPTVADRIAETVVKRYLEALVEPWLHQDPYGYRPGKSALWRGSPLKLPVCAGELRTRTGNLHSVVSSPCTHCVPNGFDWRRAQDG